MTLEQLEELHRRNPASPMFARLAEAYLDVGRVSEARQLCETGLKRFPHYATANLVLARCFAACNDYSVALGHIERVISYQPCNARLIRLQREWFELLETFPPLPPPPPEITVGLPTELEATPTLQPSEMAPAIDIEPPHSPPDLEDLATRLETIERIKPVAETLPRIPEAIETEPSEETGIVSATLAEIYADQGAFEAAIAIYRKLQKQQPHKTEQYARRIRELQDRP